MVSEKRDVMVKAQMILKAYKELYNNSLEESIDNFNRNWDSEDMERDISENFFRLKSRLNGIWENSRFEYLDNRSIKEFFDGIDDPDLLREILLKYSIDCDEDMPASLLDRIYSLGYDHVKELVLSMIDPIHEKDHGEGFLTVVWGMKLSGLWKVTEAPIKIFDFLDGVLEGESEMKSLYLEKAMEALKEIGKEAIIPVLAKLSEENPYPDFVEHLALTLAHIGSENKSEAIYICLKRLFNDNSSKYIFAESLGLYGDGRAIPALRGYLVKNMKDLTMDMKFALKLSIERLGGSINDIFLS